MASPGGVPSGHPVAVKIPVVVLQLLQAVKGHKAVLALLLNAQEVVTPAMHGSNSHLVFCVSGMQAVGCLRPDLKMWCIDA